jgi:hypothetical protein
MYCINKTIEISVTIAGYRHQAWWRRHHHSSSRHLSQVPEHSSPRLGSLSTGWFRHRHSFEFWYWMPNSQNLYEWGNEYTLHVHVHTRLLMVFWPVVSCVSPASAFRHRGQSGTTGHGLVRHCPAKSVTLPAAPKARVKKLVASVAFQVRVIRV